MTDILDRLKGCATQDPMRDDAITEIERLRAELKIVENGAAACGRFVLAHKELALEEDPAAYLLGHAHGVAERKGGSTPWLNDMLNGSIRERRKARHETFLDAAKRVEHCPVAPDGSYDYDDEVGKFLAAMLRRAAEEDRDGE